MTIRGPGRSEHGSGSTVKRSVWQRVLRILAITSAVVLIGLIVAGVVFRQLLISYQDPWLPKVIAAGFKQQMIHINDVQLNYVEGPDNGPPLVLLHAQHMEWLSYSRVLPALSESFHVFAIDYPGHGGTVTPDDYPMTADRIGADLGAFIETIGEAVFLSGNSSGGLLSVWLAANRPDLVRAVMLEDPPLFASEFPRIRETTAYRSFVTCQAFVEEGADDFLLYWVESNAGFFDNNVFRGAGALLATMIETYRSANPGAPVDIRFLPADTVRLLVRGLDHYDARFGAAFHDGSWNEDFNHGQALEQIMAPTLLLHANHSFHADGTLAGAMSQEDADNAMSRLANGRYRRIDATHVVHLDKPAEFIDVLADYFLEGSQQQGDRK